MALVSIFQLSVFEVAFNGWIGSIRSLEEDRVKLETDDGLVDLEDDESVNCDFRMLSSRGVYEPIVDWRRNEDDGGVFIGQQLYGAFGRHGEYKHGKVVDIENGDAQVIWVASGNTTFVPEPKERILYKKFENFGIRKLRKS